MRRDNPLTLDGALKILGKHEPKTIGLLDKILGGVILVGGGIAAATNPALVPLAMLAASWGWVDQKNEAVKLVRAAVDAVSARFSATNGHDRVDLLAAAHTTIVVAGYFEALREALGESQWAKLDFSADEQVNVALDVRPSDFLSTLYTAEVPRPCATQGFVESNELVREWMTGLSVRCMHFMRGLAGFEDISPVIFAETPRNGLKRYRSLYLQLADQAPEFNIWASLAEHAATRDATRILGADLHAALDGQSDALARVESLLTISRTCPEPVDLALKLHRANQRVLDQPIVDSSADRHELPINVPTVAEAYLNPRYRHARYDSEQSRPGDESWWDAQPAGDDLDLLVVDHVTGPEAQRLPMLLLGHPGAGKSLLTKVLAARLPPSSYTVVRVPLRRVSADVPLYRQIQLALDLDTNCRIGWPELVEQTSDTIRVVLLDGLDELLQATAHDRAGYLHEIVDFQRAEAAQLRPVIVVVTSRTVVADRVDIPPGTPVVRLDDFDDAQTRAWIDQWRATNDTAIRAGRLGAITHEAALAQGVLARQPLLLLMLALYCADPAAAPLDSDLSRAALYRKLIDNFALREVRKRADGGLTGDRLRDAVDDQVGRLAIAALGMFNRGRQDITDRELGADLAALGEAGDAPDPAESGRRALAEFFFVHTAEAQTLASGPAPSERHGATRRCYEFLHATFGEYLVAARIVEALADTADSTVGRRRTHEPDDSFLFAVTGHQSIAGRQPVLEFARQLLMELEPDEREQIDGVLVTLLAEVRQRPDSAKFAGYLPTAQDRLRRMAAYSANLVLLRLLLCPVEHGLAWADLWPDQNEQDAAASWRATVNMWRAGLDPGGWQAMMTTLHSFEAKVYLTTADQSLTYDIGGLLYARLSGDQVMERHLRIGTAVTGELIYTLLPHDDAPTVVLTKLLARNNGSPIPMPLLPIPDGLEDDDLYALDDMVVRQLIQFSGRWSTQVVEVSVRWLLESPGHHRLRSYALTAAVCAHPDMLSGLPWRELAAHFRGPGTRLMVDVALAIRAYTDPERNQLADFCQAVFPRASDEPRFDTLLQRGDHVGLQVRDLLSAFMPDQKRLL
ncbi:NACHT domain-containing protein [Catellatospora sichuanensis]|uniref:NACHT domain-containing protein n=1 Tax=Catellatospora sichuanensis TaxID=1969805 RepID=UPI001183BA6A|nr:ATP-binding protein [Catellatospora sichuanensis]